MYNNEVTYDKKWETPENLAALREVEDKYFDKSFCSPSCPASWAPEVLELLNTLERELGIRYNDRTIRAYFPEGNPIQWFITRPFNEACHAFHRKFLHVHDKESSSYKRNIEGKSKLRLLMDVIKSATRPMIYGYKVIRVLYINKYLNNIFKPKLTLSQVKEKCGYLTIYFDCPPAFNNYVNELIRSTVVKIAMKGAYYPLENLYNSSTTYNVDNEFEPDSISVKKYTDKNGVTHTTVSKTTYRKTMQELGINLEELKIKAEAKNKNKKRKR